MIYLRFENEKIISQIVGKGKNGNRVSKNDKSLHICNMELKCVCVKNKKWDSAYLCCLRCNCKFILGRIRAQIF